MIAETTFQVDSFRHVKLRRDEARKQRRAIADSGTGPLTRVSRRKPSAQPPSVMRSYCSFRTIRSKDGRNSHEHHGLQSPPASHSLPEYGHSFPHILSKRTSRAPKRATSTRRDSSARRARRGFTRRAILGFSGKVRFEGCPGQKSVQSLDSGRS